MNTIYFQIIRFGTAFFSDHWEMFLFIQLQPHICLLSLSLFFINWFASSCLCIASFRFWFDSSCNMARFSKRSNSCALICLYSIKSSLTNSKAAPLPCFLVFFLVPSLSIGRALDLTELKSLASLSWDLWDPLLPEPVFPHTWIHNVVDHGQRPILTLNWSVHSYHLDVALVLSPIHHSPTTRFVAYA